MNTAQESLLSRASGTIAALKRYIYTYAKENGEKKEMGKWKIGINKALQIGHQTRLKPE